MNADIVKLIRFQHGLTQAELAERIGVSHALISHIEAGRKRLTETIAERIKAAFGITNEGLQRLIYLNAQLKSGGQ